MSNVTNLQKLDTSFLVLMEMNERREAKLKEGISKTWLSNQRIIQESIIDDYRIKFRAEKPR